MNQPVPNELISAYFDGEVSPDERGEIERLLESSSELRQQLDETSKLSALLHSFPRESAPRDLAANVQRQVNVAVQPSVTARATAPATTRGSLRREWTAFGAGMLATMASLLMFVTFNRSPFITNSPTPVQSGDEPLPQVTFQSKPADQQEFADGRAAMNVANLETDASGPPEHWKRDLGISKNARFVRNKMDGLAAPNHSANKLNEEENLAQNPVSMTANYDSIVVDSNSIQPQTQNEFLSYLSSGNVIVSRVADPNNTVAVVDFTVIDIERGSDELRILLQKRSLQQVNNGEDSWSVKESDAEDRLADQQPSGAKKDLSKERDVNRPEEFQVFFVRAPGDQLAGAIDDLVKNHPDIFRNWIPQPPIELPVALQPETDGIAAEKRAIAATENKTQDNSLSLLSDETTAVNAEAELAVGVLMARNGSVNANGDFYYNANSTVPYNANSTVPLNVSNSIIGNTANPGQKIEFPAPAAASVKSNPQVTVTDNNLPGNNAQIAGNSGQGYFRVSRQNAPHVALQQAASARNKGAPLVAGSMLNTTTLDSPSGLGGGIGRNSMVNTNNDTRNPRLVRMLFVLKSGQTNNPAP